MTQQNQTAGESRAALEMSRIGLIHRSQRTEAAMVIHSALAEERRELVDALEDLVKLYVANRGRKDSEFISCITPQHSSEMTPQERAKCKVWKAWDKARALLAKYET